MRKLYWSDLTSSEFASLDPGRTIAVLPTAATEQHGPHLAVATDAIIAEGMIKTVLGLLPENLTVLILPLQAVGKSNEHLGWPGTITLSADTASRLWLEIGRSVHRAGLRKLVIVNSHGGNVDVIATVARDLRIELQMLVVHTSWRRLGLPEGLYDDVETVHGIHAGDIETSLMLHFRPDLVRMDRAENFVPASVAMERDFKLLRPTGPNAFGWIARDLNADGAVGNAAGASAEKGRLTAEHQAHQFIVLLRDVEAFSLLRLA